MLVVHKANLGYYIIDMFGLSLTFTWVWSEDPAPLPLNKAFETSSSRQKYGVHGTYSEM